MEHILLKEKNDIINWLDKYQIKNYTLIPNLELGYIVNVSGDVSLSNKDLVAIEVQFNIIRGSFYCCYNNLTSLKGCPKWTTGVYLVAHNKLKSLEHAPLMVGESFYVSNNELTSLSGAPKKIKGSFCCNYNQLQEIQLVQLPDIKGYIYLQNNPKLGTLQKITDINEIREVLKIREENQLLDNILNKFEKNKTHKI